MNFYEESRKFALEHVEPYAKRSDEEGRATQLLVFAT